MARKIGQMLNSREPKIVNGPQILDKYVGESEANIRRLFAEAEEEEKRMGPLSGLHIIIFDEIDAICKVCMIFFIISFIVSWGYLGDWKKYLEIVAMLLTSKHFLVEQSFPKRYYTSFQLEGLQICEPSK